MATSLDDTETAVDLMRSRDSENKESKKGSLIFSKESSKSAIIDYLQDFESLKKLANKNDASAQYLMSQALYYGWFGCVINKLQSNSYLFEAVKQPKTPAGQCASALCLFRAMSDGKRIDFQTVTILLKNSIKAEYVPAMWEMAFSIIKPGDDLLMPEHNFHGISAYTSRTLTPMEKTSSEELEYAIDLLTKAAKANFVPAIATLSYCYLNGRGVTQNYNASFEFARQAAMAGHAESKFLLGFHYQNGYGTTMNVKEAQKWYKAASEQGYELAREYLPKSSCIVM